MGLAGAAGIVALLASEKAYALNEQSPFVTWGPSTGMVSPESAPAGTTPAAEVTAHMRAETYAGTPTAWPRLARGRRRGDPVLAHTKDRVSDKDDEGLLGPVRIGPMLGLVSLPMPLNVEVMAKYKKSFSLGLHYRAIPTINVSVASIKMNDIGATARWYPFKGSFFLGAGMGRQSASISATDNGTVRSVSVDRTVVSPELGWLWMWKSGFALELAMGAQIPVGYTTSNSGLGPVTEDVDHYAQVAAKTPIPNLSLLRIGFLL